MTEVDKIMSVFNEVLSWGTWIRESGLTPSLLLLVGLLFSLTLMISVRELVSWYLKIPQLEGQLRDLKKTISRLEQKIEERNRVPDAPISADPIVRIAKPVNADRNFPLQH